MDLEERLRGALKVKKKTPLSQLIKKGYKLLFIVLTLFLVVLVSLYIWLKGDYQQKGYVLNQERVEIESLETVNRELEKEVVKSKSLNNIQDREVLDSMNKEYEVEYVKDDGTVSVIRKGS